MKTKLGIYGGTYAPVHNGHIRAAIEFKRQFELDRLLIMPTSVPPHKDMPKGDTTEHRLNMLKLAFGDRKDIEVSTFELSRPGKSYTVDTLRHFYQEDTDLYFLCGTDMLLTLHWWREPEEIAELTTLVYTRREGSDPVLDRQVDEQVKILTEKYGFRIRELIMSPLELSSTLVRTAEDKTPYLPKAVLDYIKENGLYV